VTELLDEALEAGEFDAVDSIARRLPMQMLAQIMGVPADDAAWLVEKGDALISNSDPDYTDFVIDKVDTDEYRLLPFRSPAAVELFDYANDLLDRMDAGEQIGVLNWCARKPATARECRATSSATSSAFWSRRERHYPLFDRGDAAFAGEQPGLAGAAAATRFRAVGRSDRRDDPLGVAHLALPPHRHA
jgi:hypothetical protein